MMNFLLVDDQLDICKMVEWKLKKTGWNFHFALNGEHGVRVALDLQPDIILTDMNMPVMDGSAAVKALRKKNYDGLIVAFTAGYAT